MSSLVSIRFQSFDLEEMAQAEGRVVIIIPAEGKMGPAARRANRLTRGARGAVGRKRPICQGQTGRCRLAGLARRNGGRGA